jgi:hypothetical protein
VVSEWRSHVAAVGQRDEHEARAARSTEAKPAQREVTDDLSGDAHPHADADS